MNKQIFWIGILAILGIMSNSMANADSMYDAVQEGDIETVKLLIEDDADINAMGVLGHPPLNHAAACGHINITEYLISKGADINGRDQDGGTPLQTAAFWAQKDVSIVLISKGSDINSKDYFGLTPLHAAAGGYDSKDTSMTVTMAMMAKAITLNADEAKKAREIVEILVSSGATVSAKDNNGFTPLHWAAKEGRKSIAEFLISNGANVNSKSKGRFFKKGKTPLRLAIDEGHNEIIVLLKNHGAEE